MNSLFWSSYVVLWASVALESLLLFVLLRELGRVYLAETNSLSRDGIAVGHAVPNVTIGLRDSEDKLASLLTGTEQTVLLFASTACRLCRDAVTAIPTIKRRHPEAELALIVGGDDRGPFDVVTDVEVALIPKEVMHRKMRVRATPYAMVVTGGGVVTAKGIVNTDSDLEALLAKGAWQLASSNASSPERTQPVEGDDRRARIAT